MVDIYRVSVKRTDDYCTIEELRHPSEEEDQTAPVPRVETERNATLEKVLAIFCFLLLVALVFLSVYHFKNVNQKEQNLEELRNINDILTSNYSALFKVHATLQSQYARNYSALQSLYTILKEKDDKESKQFSNLKEFYCYATNTLHENTCPVCKLGWVHFKSKCYFLSIDTLTWNESRNWCKKLDGQLVNIERSDELDFLAYHADTIKRIGKIYWIDRYNINKVNSTTKMDTGPVKSKRARDDNKDCWKFDFGFLNSSIYNCELPLRRICESTLHPLHI